jgi:cyclin C
MEFYLLEDLDFHLIIFHPYRSLLAICGREPSDTGKFPKSRIEEDTEIRKKEGEARKKRDEEIRKAGPAGKAGASAIASPGVGLPSTPGGVGVGATTPSAGEIATSGDVAEIKEETEEQRLRRLMSRGTGEGLMDIDEGVMQISL